jgi:hypothetical protein
MMIVSVRIGAVAKDERLHEMPIKIFQRGARSLSEARIAFPQFRPDESEPKFTRHTHFGPQSRRRTGGMRVQKPFHVIFDLTRKFFYRK